MEEHMAKTQKQMYYEAERHSANLNQAFMDMVNHPTNPLTNSDLRKLIERRPDTYGRFQNFIGKLKD